MGAGIGFTKDGASGLRSNRALLKDRSATYRNYLKKSKGKNNDLAFLERKATPEELEAVRLKTRKATIKEAIKQGLILLFSATVVGGLLVCMLYF